MGQNNKLRQHLATFWRSIDFRGGSEFSRASEGPQDGGQMTGNNFFECRDINRPAPMPKYGAIATT